MLFLPHFYAEFIAETDTMLVTKVVDGLCSAPWACVFTATHQQSRPNMLSKEYDMKSTMQSHLQLFFDVLLIMGTWTFSIFHQPNCFIDGIPITFI
jgi:hypothetical protein